MGVSTENPNENVPRRTKRSTQTREIKRALDSEAKKNAFSVVAGAISRATKKSLQSTTAEKRARRWFEATKYNRTRTRISLSYLIFFLLSSEEKYVLGARVEKKSVHVLYVYEKRERISAYCAPERIGFTFWLRSWRFQDNNVILLGM